MITPDSGLPIFMTTTHKALKATQEAMERTVAHIAQEHELDANWLTFAYMAHVVAIGRMSGEWDELMTYADSVIEGMEECES